MLCMKNKKNLLLMFLLAILIVVVYIIVSVKPLNSEINFISQWNLPLSTDVNENPSNSKLIPFKLGKTAGYFSLTGDFYYKYTIEDKVSISQDYWTMYKNNAEKSEIHNPDNSLLCTINDIGFPFIDDNRLYLFPPGGSSVSRYDNTGKLLWKYEGYVPITCFNSSTGGTVLGSADGEVRCIDANGKSYVNLFPRGSDYSVILGVAISNSGTDIACVSGLNKQRFLLIRVVNNQNKIVFHEYLEGNLREPVCVYFSEDSNYAYYGFKDSLGIIDCNSLESKHIPIMGKILKISEIPSSNVVFVLSRYGRNCKITILEGMANVLGQYDFMANDVYVNSYADNLFIGADDVISCIKIQKN